MNEKNWLITGGFGFIGSQLAKTLLSNGYSVRIIDNLSVGSLDSVSDQEHIPNQILEAPERWGKLDYVIGDIRDRDLLKWSLKGACNIVHLAASTGVLESINNPFVDCEINTLGTLNLLVEGKRSGVKKFIFSSSGAVLGNQDLPIYEGQLPAPLSPYGASKLSAESYCHSYSVISDIAVTVLRFSNVYGPGSKHKNSLIPKMIKTGISGGIFTINGDGEQTRDFIYVEDIISAILLCSINDSAKFQIYQIASGCETSVNQVAKAVSAALAKRKIQMHLQHTESKGGEVRRNYASISRATEILGFIPTTKLLDGLEITIDSFLNEQA